jgi:hypothetical protein
MRGIIAAIVTQCLGEDCGLTVDLSFYANGQIGMYVNLSQFTLFETADFCEIEMKTYASFAPGGGSWNTICSMGADSYIFTPKPSFLSLPLGSTYKAQVHVSGGYYDAEDPSQFISDECYSSSTEVQPPICSAATYTFRYMAPQLIGRLVGGSNAVACVVYMTMVGGVKVFTIESSSVIDCRSPQNLLSGGSVTIGTQQTAMIVEYDAITNFADIASTPIKCAASGTITIPAFDCTTGITTSWPTTTILEVALDGTFPSDVSCVVAIAGREDVTSSCGDSFSFTVTGAGGQDLSVTYEVTKGGSVLCSSSAYTVTVPYTLCLFSSASEESTLVKAHESYASIVRMVMDAADVGSASSAVNGASSIVKVTMESYPCFYCYGALGSGIWTSLQTAATRNACADEYSSSCFSEISGPLSQFSTCSGMTLPSLAANRCTASEWDAIRSGRVLTSLLAQLTTRPDSASGAYTQLMAPVRTDNPGMSFGCDSCIQEFINSVASGELELPLTAFKRCAGFEFPLSYSLPCDPEEFLHVDAVHGAYSSLMQSSLTGTTLVPSPLLDAYSRLPCRSCFDAFYREIAENRDVLVTSQDGVNGPCGSTSTIFSSGASSANCIDSTTTVTVVNSALIEFEKCAGTGNALWTERINTASPKLKILLNDALRVFEPVIECSTLGDPGSVYGSPGSVWKECLVNRMPILSIVADSDWYCYQFLGPAMTERGVDCSDGFSTGCQWALSTNTSVTQLDSPLMNFYQCAGFVLKATPTLCTKQQHSLIPALYTSFVPLLDTALIATDVYDAVARVFKKDDLLTAIVESLPCMSCFPRLAAELNFGLSADLKRLCNSDPYSQSCFGSTGVIEALTNFATCTGGMVLSVESPFKITEEQRVEFDNYQLEKTTLGFIVMSKNMNLFSALFYWIDFVKTIPNPPPVVKCFQDLIIDFDAVPKTVVEECNVDLSSMACLAGGANTPLGKFQRCSGYPFAVPTTTDSVREIAQSHIQTRDDEKGTYPSRGLMLMFHISLAFFLS